MIANHFVCQHSNPWSCAFDNRTQKTASWSYFPFSNLRCYLRNCEIIMRLFFLWVTSKNDSLVLERLPDGCCLLSSRNQSFSQYGLKVPCKSSVENVSFRISKNFYTTHQFKFLLEYLQNTLELQVNNKRFQSLYSQCSTLFFELSSKIFCNHTSSLKSWTPSRTTFLSNTDFIASQCLDPSDSRSSWSKWRNMVVTVLDIRIAKSLPRLGLAWIVIHFFTFLGIVFLV